MEFYVVKDLVQIVDLEELRDGMGDDQHPQPYLYFKLKFPWQIEPGDESEPAKYLAGRVKEIVHKNDSSSSAEVCLVFTNCEGKDLQKCWIKFNFDDLYCVYDGFDCIFSDCGRPDIKFKIALSLCHLPTEDTPVSPDALFTQTKAMKRWENKYDDIFGFRSENRAELEEIQRLWSFETGFVYSKLTILAEVNKVGVKVVMDDNDHNEKAYRAIDMTKKMWVQDTGKDLEIICGNGKIVKAHSGVLSASSAVFQAMFQASDMEEAKTGKLDMEEMSEKGVRAFLGWIYCSDEKEALMDSGVAVELLIAGDKYNLDELAREMEKIILCRRGFDEEWFSMESAVDLYRWAKVKDGKHKLREKAVRVLNFIGKTYPEKLVGSEEYQELIKNETAESAVSTGAPTEERDWFDKWEANVDWYTTLYLGKPSRSQVVVVEPMKSFF